MVTTKQKPVVNTQKIKDYKHTTKESYQTTEEESKRRIKEQRNGAVAGRNSDQERFLFRGAWVA